MEPKLFRAYQRATKLGLNGLKDQILETLREDSTEKTRENAAADNPAISVEENNSPHVLLNAAHAAMEAGKFKKAFSFLGQLAPDEESLSSFLRTCPFLKDLLQAHSLGKKLAKTKHDPERFLILKNLPIGEGELPLSPDRDLTLALSIFFADPLLWFDKNHENLNRLALLISSLEPFRNAITTLFSVFEQNSLKLHTPEWECALWGPFLEGTVHTPWRGVALLHVYLARQGNDNTLLWKAWEHFQAQTEGRQWQKLHAWASACVRDAEQIPLDKASELAICLKLVSPPALLIRDDVSTYLSVLGLPRNDRLVQALLAFVRKEQDSTLELRLLTGLSQLRRLTIEELTRLNALGEKLGEKQLLNQAQAIMQVRQVIGNPQQAQTLISRFVELRAPSLQELSRCLHGFSTAERKFASAYIRVGAWLTFFAFKDRDGFRFLKNREMNRDPSAKKVTRLLSHSIFSFPPKLLVFESNFVPNLACELPPHCYRLSASEWGKLWGRLVQWYGLNRLAYNLNLLMETRDERTSSPQSKEFQKWFERAGKEIKANAYQLQKASEALDDKQKTTVLLKFLTRLTTAICPDPQLALSSLSDSELEEDLIVDLESWILNHKPPRANYSL
ncbi:MAG: hypothetical protein HYW48_04170 [Deltaproteobacteria bacterium]|nr:hypothetical protein [Deltaproteobacteria bacterium]